MKHSGNSLKQSLSTQRKSIHGCDTVRLSWRTSNTRMLAVNFRKCFAYPRTLNRRSPSLMRRDAKRYKGNSQHPAARVDHNEGICRGAARYDNNSSAIGAAHGATGYQNVAQLLFEKGA